MDIKDSQKFSRCCLLLKPLGKNPSGAVHKLLCHVSPCQIFVPQASTRVRCTFCSINVPLPYPPPLPTVHFSRLILLLSHTLRSQVTKFSSSLSANKSTLQDTNHQWQDEYFVVALLHDCINLTTVFTIWINFSSFLSRIPWNRFMD